MSILRRGDTWVLQFKRLSGLCVLFLLLAPVVWGQQLISLRQAPPSTNDLQVQVNDCVVKLVQDELSERQSRDQNIANVLQFDAASAYKLDPHGQRLLVMFEHNEEQLQPNSRGNLQTIPIRELAVAELTPAQLSQLTSPSGLPKLFEAQLWQARQDETQVNEKYNIERELLNNYHQPAWDHLQQRLNALALSPELAAPLKREISDIEKKATRQGQLMPILFLGSAEKVEATAQQLLQTLASVNSFGQPGFDEAHRQIRLFSYAAYSQAYSFEYQTVHQALVSFWAWYRAVWLTQAQASGAGSKVAIDTMASLAADYQHLFQKQVMTVTTLLLMVEEIEDWVVSRLIRGTELRSQLTKAVAKLSDLPRALAGDKSERLTQAWQFYFKTTLGKVLGVQPDYLQQMAELLSGGQTVISQRDLRQVLALSQDLYEDKSIKESKSSEARRLVDAWLMRLMISAQPDVFSLKGVKAEEISAPELSILLQSLHLQTLWPQGLDSENFDQDLAHSLPNLIRDLLVKLEGWSEPWLQALSQNRALFDDHRSGFAIDQTWAPMYRGALENLRLLSAVQSELKSQAGKELSSTKRQFLENFLQRSSDSMQQLLLLLSTLESASRLALAYSGVYQLSSWPHNPLILSNQYKINYSAYAQQRNKQGKFESQHQVIRVDVLSFYVYEPQSGRHSVYCQVRPNQLGPWPFSPTALSLGDALSGLKEVRAKDFYSDVMARYAGTFSKPTEDAYYQFALENQSWWWMNVVDGISQWKQRLFAYAQPTEYQRRLSERSYCGDTAIDRNRLGQLSFKPKNINAWPDTLQCLRRWYGHEPSLSIRSYTSDYPVSSWSGAKDGLSENFPGQRVYMCHLADERDRNKVVSKKFNECSLVTVERMR